MSVAQLIFENLPGLRHYARALAGSQMEGDAFVAATLERLVHEPEIIREESNARVDLYRAFTRVWNSLLTSGGDDEIRRESLAKDRVSNIRALTRQVSLLSSMGG